MTRLLLLASVALALGCGDETPAVVLVVDVSAYQVTEQLDLVYVEARDDTAVLVGRSFPLAEDQPRARIKIVQGPLTPDALELVAYGYAGGAVVVTSNTQTIVFGEKDRVTIELP